MRMARNISGVVALAASGFLSACGDPVPPAAQGALSIHITDANEMKHPTDNCSPYTHWVNVPHPRVNTQKQETTELESGTKAVNGQGGDSVSCSVVPNGSDFKVTIDASAYAENGDQKKLAPTHVHIVIPKIAEGDSSAPGSFSFQNDRSLTVYASRPEEPCTFSVQSKGGDSLGIVAGRIWGQISCDYVPDVKSPGSSCGVDVGYFVFENCAK